MVKIPIYSYDDLRKKADDFLLTHNPSATIPVPIEEIVEFEFDINIVPVLALQREFEVEGFTSSDLKNIYVDESSSPPKSRMKERFSKGWFMCFMG